jgi:hypothetical protein
MNFTRTNREKMAKIFNEAISETEFSHHIVSWEDFSPVPTGNLITFNPDKDPFGKMLGRIAPSRIIDKGQFFHFKNFNIAKNIISKKTIQVSNLFSNHQNDFAEYSEFFQRLGLIKNLIPKDFYERPENVTSRSNRPIDDDRDNMMILCFSKEGHKERFWKEYAKEDTGVCLVFRFLSFTEEAHHTYDFRDVAYDHGYRFEFLNKINHLFSQDFQKLLFVDGITRFARCYKRGQYEWENETRLIFDYGGDYKDYLPTLFPVQQDGMRKYIEIPLGKNDLFELIIDEVIVGKNVPDKDFDELKRLLSTEFPSAFIWKREYSNY